MNKQNKPLAITIFYTDSKGQTDNVLMSAITAQEYAEKKVSSGEWETFTIPSLLNKEIIESEEEMRVIECRCGNTEEMNPEEERCNANQFEHSSNTEDGEAFYICYECHSEVKSEIK